jgi:uncharacterized protein (DUF927 family)
MYFNSKKEDRTESQVVAQSSETAATIISIDAESTVALQQYKISHFNSCTDKYPKSATHTWASFCAEFKFHRPRREKDGPAWSPVSYTEGSVRGNAGVDKVYFAVIDVDSGLPPEELLVRFHGFACLIHSSYSHSAELSKYRVILPLAEPVDASEWSLIWVRINQMAGGCNDAATKDPARLYYKPAHPINTSVHFNDVQEGRFLALDDLPPLDKPVHSQPLTFLRNASTGCLPEIEGIESNGPDLNFEQGLREVDNRCAFMKFASAQDNQDSISEPLWMAMISNACRFENSEGWIHSASEHHSDYDENATDAKIRHARNGSPPITCERIRELGFKDCPSGGCRRPNGEAVKAPAALYGWMFYRQLTEAETATNQIPEEYAVGCDFMVKPTGVYQVIKRKDDDEPEHIRLCSRIDVTALTRDPESTNWGTELRFTDPDGVPKTWALPMELLASSGDTYRASLLKMGAAIEPSKKAREGLAAYLVAARPQARAVSVKQPGWSNGLFVLPNAVYGQSDERLVFQTTDPDDIKRFSQKGSLESWQQLIAAPCQGNSRAVISICIGLAPPLLALLGEDNGGFHLRGNSSIGKSVCLFLGSSVWGGSALIRTWNITVNGLEGVATMHNDILLPLDELGQAEGKAAGEAAYMLGNGQGKSRAGRDGDARAVKRFRNLVLSSGEKSMGDLMAQTGQAVMAGQEVRMVEIAADAGSGYGVFEDIHGARSAQVFAETLKQAVTQHHGHAGRAFVELLANPELRPKLIDKLKALIQRFVDTYVPAEATGQVGRVGRRFGLIAAAGELCIELGILPWPEGEAFDACRKCFAAWIDLRGGIGNHEAEQAVSQIRRFIELHGESRFTAWTSGIDNNGTGKTIQRAGFRRATGDDRTDFYILPEVYKTEMCSGLNPAFVTKTLVERGFLTTDSKGKPQIDTRLPGMGKLRIYHLKAIIMGGDVAQVENEETVGRQPMTPKAPIRYIV